MGKIVKLDDYRQEKKKTRREQIMKKFSKFLEISDELLSKVRSPKAEQLIAKGKKLITDSKDGD